MNTPEISILDGPDRIAYCETLSRRIRMGTPAALAVADMKRVRDAFAAADTQTAQTYLEYLHEFYLEMLAIYAEWVLLWPSFLAGQYGTAEAERVISNAHVRWMAGLEQVADTELGGQMAAWFAPRPPVVDDQQAISRARTLVAEILSPSMSLYQQIQQALHVGNFAAAIADFDAYGERIRTLHDIFVLGIHTYAATTGSELGQTAAAAGLQYTLSHCSYYDAMWEEVSRLSPAELAVQVAEELRAHFSGPGRQGSVTIIEEADYYRLIFDPCGSGGALRRRLAQQARTIELLVDPAPETWGKAGQVPAYCAHCAQNELAALARFGYPIWVTNFDPDPNRPCGWTIYKTPTSVPNEYWTRLGAIRPLEYDVE